MLKGRIVVADLSRPDGTGGSFMETAGFARQFPTGRFREGFSSAPFDDTQDRLRDAAKRRRLLSATRY
jgi:hypothetical protein